MRHCDKPPHYHKKKFTGPSNGIPNIRILHQNELIISVAIWSATNSAPKVEDSTVFCHFEYHTSGAEFPNKIIPVYKRRVILQLICKLLPRGSGAFGGKSLTASTYTSFISLIVLFVFTEWAWL